MNDEAADDSECIYSDLLDNVARTENKEMFKKRRMSVGLFKQKRAEHYINSNEYSKHSRLSLDKTGDRLRIPRMWQSIAKRTMMLKDPFHNFKLSELTSERATRYQYNSITKIWQTDDVYVKQEKEPFNHGAMRECYRLKKIPTYSTNTNSLSDWKHAGNYVCKRYMENVDRHVYFEDVRLQMDAKLWAEEFNRQPGVKKEVDIVRVCAIEFIDRPGTPLYHLEHFIEGNYIKYNSNSGFVDENTRNTPQAFSHFTFERSGHELIVVDIQGVGDLYTDPQIHTACKKGYGDGNLGCRGMALFFHTHKCNNVCEALVLSKFDLAPLEITSRQSSVGSTISSNTVAEFQKNPAKPIRCSRPSNNLESALINMLEADMEDLDPEASDVRRSSERRILNDVGSLKAHVSSPDSGYGVDDDICLNMTDYPPNIFITEAQKQRKQARFKFDSYCSSDSVKNDKQLMDSYVNHIHKHRPSCASAMDSNLRMGESILGEIHHEMAKMYESGRFLEKLEVNTEPNWDLVLFHEEVAARLNCMDAVFNMACYYLELPVDHFLNSCTVKPKEEDQFRGWIYLSKAAEAGHRPSMFLLANNHDVLLAESKGRDPDWCSVLHWLQKALDTMDQSDEDGGFDAADDNPSYIIKARMAAMLRTGGYGLEKNLEHAAELYGEAADEATAAMKGRLASKYYQITEEIYEEM